MVPIVDLSQPNNPNFDVWYSQLLCPWNFAGREIDAGQQQLRVCGGTDASLSHTENDGQLVCSGIHHQNDEDVCAPNQHPQYPIFPTDPYVKDEPNRRTMSCALCARLKRTFPAGAPVGAPGLIKANLGFEYSVEGISTGATPPADARCSNAGAIYC